MKIVFLFILTLLTHLVTAQVHIWTQEEAQKAKFHVDILPITYEERSSDDAIDLVQKSLDIVVPKDVNPGISVITQILVNQQGSVDYIIFHTEAKGYNNDSLNQVLKKSFVQHVSEWKSVDYVDEIW